MMDCFVKYFKSYLGKLIEVEKSFEAKYLIRPEEGNSAVFGQKCLISTNRYIG